MYSIAAEVSFEKTLIAQPTSIFPKWLPPLSRTLAFNFGAIFSSNFYMPDGLPKIHEHDNKPSTQVI